MEQAQRLRIGILGAARIAPSAVITPARRLGIADVTAIAARSGERARAFAARHSVATVHADYAALVDDSEVDAVYIALPNALHYGWSLRALAAGKHVLCEKPLTSNAPEADALARSADESGRVLMEAMHSLYHPLMLRALDLLRSGEVGRIERIEATFRTPMLRRKDIRFDYALGGGALMDLGCYMLSMTRVLSGEEPSVEWARATLRSNEVDRRMQAVLRLPSGATAAIDVEMQARRVPDVRIVVSGTRGEVRLYNPVLPHLWHRLEVRTARGRRREQVMRVSSYECQLQAFVENVARGTRPITDASFAHKTMRLIDEIYCLAGLQPRGGSK